MIERHQHNNPWAEKLSQVSLPDSGTAWLAMGTLLDKEMPTDWRKDRRRWPLLILLLLLLIGVCNCPGRGRFSAATTQWRWPKAFQTVATDDKIAHGPSPVAGGTPTPIAGDGGTPVTSGKPRRLTAASPATGSTRRSSSADSQPPATSSIAGSPEASSPGINSPAANSPETGSPSKHASIPAAGSPDSTATIPPKKKDSVAAPVHKQLLKDSTHKKPITPPVEKPKKEKENGWMVGIGLNQFFPLGGQQTSSWNSDGIAGTLSDYIPVPMIRYYFNAKLYVQLEAQINTPQATQKNLVINSTVTSLDSGSTGRPAVTTDTARSVAVTKLFYFNLPLSVHYTVFDHLDLGAGLQFSRLTNGIGVFNSDIQSRTSDALSTQTKSFKGDSVYQEMKTHEFRFLLDANYTYQHFILGLRYNQALSKFINVRLAATGQVTQARNSSLQLYLRYILWDGRKKKPLLPAK